MLAPAPFRLVLLLFLLAACARSNGLTDGGSPDGGSPDGGSADAGTLAGKMRAFTEKLGGGHAGHFLIGMGNDGTNSGDDPAYHLGATIDLHYHYLVGLSTEGGWPTWNSNPDYAGKRVREARSHGVVPMITYYAMAAHGDGNVAGSVQDASFMNVWWKDFAQVLASINAEGGPVVLQVEPDFWGYLQQRSASAGGPDKVVAKVAASGYPECAGKPDTVAGWGECLLAAIRARAPNALAGLHASVWGSGMDVRRNTNPSLDVAGEAARSVGFFRAVGGDRFDFISSDSIDRDAGCYEAGLTVTGNVICRMRSSSLLDESNATLPSYRQMLTWFKALTAGLRLPGIWWQLPFGVPSATPGGTPGHYRDNHTHYVFGHIADFVDAGAVGAVWGTGAGYQTFIDTDGGAYKAAVVAYFASPFRLP